MSEKKTPIDSADPELKKVMRMPDATLRCSEGNGVHHHRGVGRAEHARADAVDEGQERERPVGEVDGSAPSGRGTRRGERVRDGERRAPYRSER